MGNIGEIGKLLSNELLQSFLSRDQLKLAEAFVLIRLLISLNIPFSFGFSEKTRAKECSITLRIRLSVSSTFEYSFDLEQ